MPSRVLTVCGGLFYCLNRSGDLSPCVLYLLQKQLADNRSGFRKEDFPILGEIVRRHAARISERLGYRPAPVSAA